VRGRGQKRAGERLLGAAQLTYNLFGLLRLPLAPYMNATRRLSVAETAHHHGAAPFTRLLHSPNIAAFLVEFVYRSEMRCIFGLCTKCLESHLVWNTLVCRGGSKRGQGPRLTVKSLTPLWPPTAPSKVIMTQAL